MKYIDPEILALQKENIRTPDSELRIFDPLVRWSKRDESMSVTPYDTFNHERYKSTGGKGSAFFDAHRGYYESDHVDTFDNDNDGWSTNDDVVINTSHNATEGHDAVGALEVVVSQDPIYLGLERIQSPRFVVSPGATLNVPFWLMGNTANPDNWAYGIVWFDETDTYLSEDYVTVSGLPTVWTEYTITQTVPAGATYGRVGIWFTVGEGGNSSYDTFALYIDDVKRPKVVLNSEGYKTDIFNSSVDGWTEVDQWSLVTNVSSEGSLSFYVYNGSSGYKDGAKSPLFYFGTGYKALIDVSLDARHAAGSTPDFYYGFYWYDENANKIGEDLTSATLSSSFQTLETSVHPPDNAAYGRVVGLVSVQTSPSWETYVWLDNVTYPAGLPGPNRISFYTYDPSENVIYHGFYDTETLQFETEPYKDWATGQVEFVPGQRMAAHESVGMAYIPEVGTLRTLIPGEEYSPPSGLNYAIAWTDHTHYVATLNNASDYDIIPPDAEKLLQIYVYSSDGSYHIIHEQKVSAEYDVASISWFDAVAMDGRKDLVLFNAKAHGQPKVIHVHYSSWTAADIGAPFDADYNEVHSDPLPVIPLDIVNNYSYIKLGWVERVGDLFVATGVVGREGSTGAHPQQWDVALRSKDGVHWTMDRYSYMGGLDMRSPIIFNVDTNTMYKFDLRDIYEAEMTVLFGGTAEEIVVKDDLKNWNLRQNAGGIEASSTLRAMGRKYTNPALSTHLKPGYMIQRYAGYKNDGVSNLGLISTEAIDSAPRSLQGDAGRRLSLSSRSWAKRLLEDWGSDQDWQWLSQQKLYDDCDDLSHLYAVSGVVPTPDDSGFLKYDKYNEPMVLFASNPVPEGDFFASAIFEINNEEDTTSTSDMLGTREAGSVDSDYTNWTGVYETEAVQEATFYTYDEFLLGTGFGVVGCGEDQYNFIAAFADLGNNRLYLLQRAGDKNSDDWEILDGAIFSELSQSTKYEVTLRRRGLTFYYGLNRYDAENRIAIIEEQAFQYDGNHELNGDNIGVLTHLRVPETQIWYADETSNYLARSWENYDDTDDTERNDSQDRFFEFHVGDRAWLEDEELEIVGMTHSNYRSAYTFMEAAVVQEPGENWTGVPSTTKTRLFVEGNKNDINDTNVDRIQPWYDTYGGTDPATRPHIGWLFAPLTNRGVGNVCWIWDVTGVHTDSPFTDDYVERVFIQLSLFAKETDSDGVWVISLNPEADETDLENYESNIDLITRYGLLPGFKVKKPDGTWRSENPGDNHGKNATFRVHHNDHIDVHHFQGYDAVHDKNMDWVLKDIATKAGILDFAGSHNALDTEMWGTRLPSDGARHLVNTFNIKTSGKVIDFDLLIRMHTSQLLPNATFSTNSGWTLSGTGDESVTYETASEYAYIDHTYGEAVLESDQVQVKPEMGALFLEVWGRVDSGSEIPLDRRPAAELYVQWINDTVGVLDEELCGYIVGEDEYQFVTKELNPDRPDVTHAKVIVKHDLGTEPLNATARLMLEYVGLHTRDETLDNDPYYASDSYYTIEVSLQQDAANTNINVVLDKNANGLELIAEQQDGGTIPFELGRVKLPYQYSWASEIRVVKYDRFVAVYLDGWWAHTFAFYSPSGDTNNDQYGDHLIYEPGTLEVTFGTDYQDGTAIVRELSKRVDGVILDQQMSARAGMERVIRDERIKLNETPDGRLVLSRYTRRPNVGQVGDTIRSDATTPSDRIPTHIRVVGAEVSEYIDHVSAAEYGLLFYLARAESLDEEEAYNEAAKIVEDALSYTEARNLRLGAYLHWMPEDKVLVEYVPYDDSSAQVSELMIVDNLQLSFSTGSLLETARLRKLYEQS